ncbi:uncharacterized protein FOMMEDRAFT_154395 [Fomitiporia mediterranea MF3/22]|uniref:uncharacterized protein n=1 Tax=Fomitiporia mediterranea (strain MF3/22) TaxID=694068 RepID=UPI00044082AF|nr:uncharacterized protein FOMMEDRAFT_154395 [Fomitiporia mediterranea MF3/22]EJD05182.1 hypothetical protein FOMMEDRAFT_154395 [Fomitiporia mediterranea MF3/22]
MLDYSSNSTCYHSRDLWSNIPFETYSDAKLAALVLDNMEDFSVRLFQQVINVITDPQFKPSELTFKNIWGIFDSVSAHRKSSVLDRSVAKPHKVEMTSGVVPPVVLGLVVDEIAQQNTPFAMLAEKKCWDEAFARNRTDLFNMSLVHRSWTEFAYNGKRRRAIIPYQQINRFLLSPFCGPWVKEMIIYWMPDDHDVVSLSDLELLENLLARTPNVHTLAFNTTLSSCRLHRTSLEVHDCLDTIAHALSDLRHVWLNHFQCECGHVPECGSEFVPCYELESLYGLIPKMRTLEPLSMKG